MRQKIFCRPPYVSQSHLWAPQWPLRPNPRRYRLAGFDPRRGGQDRSTGSSLHASAGAGSTPASAVSVRLGGRGSGSGPFLRVIESGAFLCLWPGREGEDTWVSWWRRNTAKSVGMLGIPVPKAIPAKELVRCSKSVQFVDGQTFAGPLGRGKRVFLCSALSLPSHMAVGKLLGSRTRVQKVGGALADKVPFVWRGLER